MEVYFFYLVLEAQSAIFDIILNRSVLVMYFTAHGCVKTLLMYQWQASTGIEISALPYGCQNFLGEYTLIEDFLLNIFLKVTLPQGQVQSKLSFQPWGVWLHSWVIQLN